VLDNGSGLSREERSNAQALSALLHLAAQSPYAAALQNSLAIAGVDGTVARLKDRQPKSVAIGRAHLKSGSLKDVASLAGYVDGLSGKRYVFVVIVNHGFQIIDVVFVVKSNPIVIGFIHFKKPAINRIVILYFTD
jgi:D-alanyl-D-alanine carboxypeptidase/D-alanyl-D-alanine-endopeptidase (penicillin-binding protein 4)